jgi:hypothetical protein
MNPTHVNASRKFFFGEDATLTTFIAHQRRISVVCDDE